MKATIKPNPNLVLELEEEKPTDLFERIASIHEVFGIVGNEACALCGSKDLSFTLRQNKDEDKFYEIKCRGYNSQTKKHCGGKLSISVNKGKEGNMYPVRKLKNGLPAKITDEPPFDYSTRGWHRWEGQTTEASGANTTTDKKTKK